MNLDDVSIGNFRRRIGGLEFREIETTTLTCLAAFLRWSGVAVKLDNLLDIAPVPPSGVSSNLLFYLARRIGLRVSPIELNRIRLALPQHPILIQRESGYALLLLNLDDSAFIAALPGHPDEICRIPFESDLLVGRVAAHELVLLPNGPARRMSSCPPKFWLLQWRHYYTATYDVDAVLELKRTFPFGKHKEVTPVPLLELTTDALKESHRSICVQLPEYYGCFRTINLRRGCIFVDFAGVPQVTEELLALAREVAVEAQAEVISFAARLFTEFLSIHPFLNANRRMATLVVTKFLERWEMVIQWEKINSSQLYYWTRCASHGHFGFLEKGFIGSLKSTPKLDCAREPN